MPRSYAMYVTVGNDNALIRAYADNVGHAPVNRYTEGRAANQWSYPKVNGRRVAKRDAAVIVPMLAGYAPAQGVLVAA